MTGSHRAVGDDHGDTVGDKARSMSWQDLTEQSETQRDTKLETNLLHAVTTSHKAVGNKVGDTVGGKARSMP